MNNLALEENNIKLNTFYDSDEIIDKLNAYWEIEFSNDLHLISFTESGCVTSIALVEEKRQGVKGLLKILDYISICAVESGEDEVPRERIETVCNQIASRLFCRGLEIK